MVLILLGRLIGLLSRATPQTAARLALWLARRTRRTRAAGPGREVARHRIDGGEVVLHSLTAGRGGARVLLVHDGNAGAADWAPLARHFERSEAMALAEVDAERNARRIAAPTLLVHDVDVRVIALAHGEARAQRLPAARLLRTNGLGQRRLLADAEVARPVADFSAAGA